MTDFEHEKQLHELRAQAWDAFMKAYARTADAGQIFAAVAEVYEGELRTGFSIDEASDRDYADEIRDISRARDLAYEELDSAPSDRLQSIIAELDKVLGPDLVREADPTGKFLKSLPFEERKRILDAIDSGSKVIFVEDEMGPILDKARRLRESGEDR